MHDRDQIKIDVISGIDEEIVDRNTQKRFELEERIGKKRPIRWIPIVAAAASFFIIAVSILWLIPIFTKQVPVYQGMTVSGAPLTEQVAANTEDIPKINVFELFGEKLAPVQSISLSRVGAPVVLKNGDNGNHYGNDKGNNKAESTDSSTISGIGGPDSIYYAEPNEDIYITIHISNPDEYEILSFTLNGEKYSSYMFEQGSDMEHLILKKNVGDAEGVIEYTIDAIKYVDGTEIKDVRMDGDRTVKVGVYTEEQPKAKIEKLTADFNTLSFNISFKDKLNLITLSGGSVKAILYCGEEEIEEKEIALGEEQHIEFNGLELDTEYRYVIEATYDDLSGDGVAKHVLAEGTVRTLQPIKFASVIVLQESIEFELVWHEDYEGKEITSLELYHNGEKIKELSVNERKVEGLLSDNNYTIKATYINEDEEKAVELSVHTEAKKMPEISFSDITKTQTDIGFNIQVSDIDSVGEITAIELYLGETLVRTAESLDIDNFAELLSNNTYTVKVSYKYDLNDGLGERTLVESVDIKTEPKEMPTISFSAVTKTQTDIGFNIQVSDIDSVGEITAIELYLGETLVRTAERLDIDNFAELLSNNTYTVKISYKYDLNDGLGERTLVKHVEIKTEAKAAPSFDFADLETTDNSISGEYTVTDVDNILSSCKLEIYKASELISQSAGKSFSFTTLNYYTDYTLRITYSYDLNDGRGEQSASYENTVRTLPHIDVTEFKILNSSAIFQGDTVFAQLTIENPLNMTVNSVTVNGVECIATNLSSTQILVDIVCDGDGYAVGNTELRIEKVNASINGESFSIAPKTEQSSTVFINGKIRFIKAEWINEDLEPTVWVFPDERYYVMITLDNPTGYDLKSASDDGIYGAKKLIKIDDNRWYYIPENASVMLYSLSYYVGEEVRTINCNHTQLDYLTVLRSKEIRYISTADDLKNMDDGYYYELTNDIDLAGIQWKGGSFDGGVFEGNGYKIKNMTHVGSENDDWFICGLFRYCAFGVIQNLTLENVNIVVEVMGVNPYAYVGGFVGYGNIKLYNCTVSENSIISVTVIAEEDQDYYSYSTAVGGFTGCAEGLIEKCTNNAIIRVDTSNAQCDTNVGGFVGGQMGHEVVIIDSVNTGYIYVSGSDINVGGAIGEGYGISISNFINSGKIHKYIDGYYSNSGGFVAEIGWTDKIIISGSVDMSSEDKFINDTRAEITNSYSLMSDDYPCTIEQLNSKEFYTETLGWSEYVWDLSELDVANGKYPKLK